MQMLRRKFTVILVCLLMLLGVGVFFRETLLSMGLEYYLQRYCQRSFNCHVQMERVYRKGATWVIAKPILKHVSSDAIFLTAEEITINHRLELLARQIHLDVLVDTPEIGIEPHTAYGTNASPISYSLFSLPDIGLLNSVGNLVIKNGAIRFGDDAKLHFQLNGSKNAQLSVEGCAFFETADASENLIEFNVLEKENDQFTAHIFSHNVDCSQLFSAFQAAAPKNSWHVTSGHCNGHFEATISKESSRIKGDIQLNEITFHNPSLQIAGNIPKAFLHLTDNAADSNFTLLAPASLTDEKRKWLLNEIVGDISFQGGDALIGLKGIFQCNDQAFEIHISGKAPLSPPDHKEALALQIQLSDHDLSYWIPFELNTEVEMRSPVVISSSFKRTDDGVQVDGVLQLVEESSNVHEIAFQYNLEAKNLSWLSGLEQFNLREGRFQAANFPLEKYLLPLISKDQNWRLKGYTDFIGLFDRKSLVLYYDLSHLSLENALFTLEVDRLCDAEGNPPAVHYFDLAAGTEGGVISLSNASYVEKNTKLRFDGIAGDLILSQNNLSTRNLEAYCQNIYLIGSLDINYRHAAEGSLDIDIHLDSLDGKVSQVQQLFTECRKPPFFFKCPLEGNILLRSDGGHLNVAIQPDQTVVQAYLQGTLNDGVIESQNFDLALQDLSLDFEYDHLANTLDISNIQGALLIGPPHRIEEYDIAGDRIKFADFSSGKGEFDLWIGDKSRDILRLAGKTEPLSEDGSSVELLLNHDLSHFGNLHPDEFQLILTEWSQIALAKMKFGCQLDSLLQDLQRFSRTGLLFLSRDLLEELNDLKSANGFFCFDLDYDHHTSLFTFRATGEEVVIGKHHFHTCLLEGRNKDNIWAIDQLHLDELSFAANLAHVDDNWKIDFLGIRYGKSILVGMEGTYFPSSRLLEAKINLLEADLASLNEWPSLSPVIDKWKPEGKLHARGSIRAEEKREGSGLTLEANFDLGLHSLKLHGVPFQDINGVPCYFVSNQGFRLENIYTSLMEDSGNSAHASLAINKLSYDLATHELTINQLKFRIPSQNLETLASQLQHHFFEESLSPITQLLGQSKNTGNLEGTANIALSKRHYTVNINLPSDRYRFFGSEHDLDKITIECTPIELRMNTQSRDAHSFLKSEFSALTSGEFAFESDLGDSFAIQWQRDPQGNFLIQKAEGRYEGVDFHLARTAENRDLEGKVSLEVEKVCHLLPKPLNETFSRWQIGGTCLLKGIWKLPIEKFHQWKEQICFKGAMEGSSLRFQEYRLDQIAARIEYSPELIHFSDIELKDISGTASSSSMDIAFKSQQEWQISMPLLTVSQFHPGRLRRAESSSEMSESAFVIRKMELENFSGNLFEPESIQAKGSVLCHNPLTEESPSTAWNIPKETLNQFGLNSAVLSPIGGVVQFRIEQGKIYLTKLKDMYSIGHLSKFYLPKNPSRPSYIDFDGNLNIQMRMKHFGLLFKFADLFTLNIKGTLAKPRFMLHRQTHESNSETTE